ncbi:sensor histidine kinase [Thalassotalea insulae]|uniref:sensor histidine kinase n=1 Tax=Thalassotalea insulae TaxID=2056778 RepID=UPI0024E0C26B|nr:histidine kinase [Thalassotalea insulae]
MTVRNIFTILLINSTFALLRALYDIYLSEQINFASLYTAFIGYFKVMNVFGFALAFTYLFLSRGPDVKLDLSRILMIGIMSFAISAPIVFFIFNWSDNQTHPIIQALVYSSSAFLSTTWAVIVMAYVQNRESQPKFQLIKQKYIEQFKVREQTELELHLLQAQIEPHFFFNTLASLHNLIDIDAEKAKYLLEELTEYLRSTVPVFRYKFVKLGEEKEMLIRYLSIQKVRFSNKFDFDIQIPKELEHLPIVPMSLLTLVENAIKHGIEKTNGKGNITISCAMTNKKNIKAIVSDSAGLYTASNNGTGLENLKSRLKITYGDDAALTIKALPEKETLAVLEVPVYD